VLNPVPGEVTELLLFFRHNESWAALDDRMLKLVLNFIARHLSEKVPPIPGDYACDTAAGPVIATHRDFTLKIQELATLALRCGSPGKMDQWAASQLLPKVISCLESPDEAEQASATALLRAICVVYPQIGLIAHDLLKREVALFRMGGAQFPVVAIALRLIDEFYDLEPSLAPDVPWFRDFALPLFASPMLPVFHQELERLREILCDTCRETLELTVAFLLRFWPLTATQKVTCFLQSLEAAVAQMQSPAVCPMARQIFGILARTIGSDHNLVSVSALHLLAKVQFWEAFGTRDVLVSIVTSAVAHAMKSWSEQVRGEAAAAMKTLTAFAAHGQAARAPANWEDIANSASQAWLDIQTAAERAQIV
jgi:hypothetical protein